MSRLVPQAAALLLLAVSAGCARESRTMGPDQPQTPPDRADDPRASRYQDNLYQVAQGGRYFTWYGCGVCHGADAKARLDLAHSASARTWPIDRIYAKIAGHAPGLPRYGDRIPPEQLWQITAYVRSLPDLPPERRRRQALDQIGEPQGSAWPGPVE
ncbi:c-type cytochrome [Sphingomonas sp.]|uniref:c-type cytochrome n=1 Tax=Sphingomonas sp. TaxID=28214 RepID=UPI003B3AC32B